MIDGGIVEKVDEHMLPRTMTMRMAGTMMMVHTGAMGTTTMTSPMTLSMTTRVTMRPSSATTRMTLTVTTWSPWRISMWRLTTKPSRHTWMPESASATSSCRADSFQLWRCRIHQLATCHLGLHHRRDLREVDRRKANMGKVVER